MWLAARYACKFGAKAVAKGMEKMGVNPAKIKKLTGVDLSGGGTRSNSANYTTVGNTKSGSKTTKPNQVHHFATNKSKKYTTQFESIAKKYGLDLDDSWNKELMPHQGRHPYAYHDYVLDNMQKFDRIANGDKTKFLKLYEQMKRKIRNKPEMLYKDYWKNK